MTPSPHTHIHTHTVYVVYVCVQTCCAQELYRSIYTCIMHVHYSTCKVRFNLFRSGVYPVNTGYTTLGLK